MALLAENKKEEKLEKPALEFICPKSICGGLLSPDTEFNTQMRTHNIGKRRFKCSNGHSFIYDNPEKLIEEQRRAATLKLVPAIPTRSVICDVCRRRVYNAHPNQKRHAGSCKQKFIREYNKKMSEMYRSFSLESRRLLKESKKNGPRT